MTTLIQGTRSAGSTAGHSQADIAVSGDSLRIRVGVGKDPMTGVLDALAKVLDTSDFPDNWKTRYAAALVAQAKGEIKPNSVIDLPIDSEEVFKLASSATPEQNETAQRQHKSEMTDPKLSSQRAAAHRQRSALRKGPVSMDRPRTATGFNPRARMKLSRAESQTLSQTQRAFLAEFEVDVGALPPAAQKQLATLLSKSQQAHRQLSRGVTPDAGVTRHVADGKMELAVTVTTERGALTLTRSFDLESQTLTTGFTFSADRVELEAKTAYRARAPNSVRAISREELSQEGIESFFEGMILGDFGENDSWSAIAGQTVLGFVPIAGQIADARDIGAALQKIARGEDGAWLSLGTSAVGVVPGLDFLKAGSKAGREVLAQASKEATQGIAAGALKTLGKKHGTDWLRHTRKTLKALAAGRVEMMARLSELARSDLMQPQWKTLVDHAHKALRDHLQPGDLTGALLDSYGKQVRKAGSGETWDHAGEVRDAIAAQEKLLRSISLRMTHLKLSLPASADELAALGEFSQALSELTALAAHFVRVTE
ncbi:MAG: hypothetical protein AAFU77_18135 [Myxococcota bacterium]